MKKIIHLAVVFTVAVVMASAVWAQRGGRMGGTGGFRANLLFLAGQKSVQDELKMTEEQVKGVEKLAEKSREGFKGGFKDFKDLSDEEKKAKMEERVKEMTEKGKENDKAVAELLKADQVKRLKQIALQQQKTSAFTSSDVAEALKFTDEQKEKIKTIQEDARKERGELKGGDREENKKKYETLQKATEEKLQGVLTDDQKSKWKELQGEAFTGEIKFQFGGKRKGKDKEKDI